MYCLLNHVRLKFAIWNSHILFVLMFLIVCIKELKESYGFKADYDFLLRVGSQGALWNISLSYATEKVSWLWLSPLSLPPYVREVYGVWMTRL